MATWCTIYVLHTHSLSFCLYGVLLCTHGVVLILMCPCSCLYGVPLVYARGRTYIDGLYVIVWCTIIMFVWCTVYVL